MKLFLDKWCNWGKWAGAAVIVLVAVQIVVRG